LPEREGALALGSRLAPQAFQGFEASTVRGLQAIGDPVQLRNGIAQFDAHSLRRLSSPAESLLQFERFEFAFRFEEFAALFELLRARGFTRREFASRIQ